MKKLGLLVTIIAKPGKEQRLSNFLAQAVELARRENKTISWYAFQIDAAPYGVFGTFESEQGRAGHLTGEIAKALTASAEDLLSTPPRIQHNNILGSK